MITTEKISSSNSVYFELGNYEAQKSESSNVHVSSVATGDKVEISNLSKILQRIDEKSSNNEELSDEEKKVVEELKKTDQSVRQHEQAHISAGGSIVRGGASYNYQIGPDGQRYAIGGEVQIDISPENDPESTIRKMQQVRRAALAPSDPSPQDRAVASMASRIESQARSELQQEKFNEDSIKVSNASVTAITPQARLAVKEYQKAESVNTITNY